MQSAPLQVFCRECGTQIYSTAESGEPKVYGVRVGTIRQRQQLAPKKQYWVRSALPWVDDISSLNMRRNEISTIKKPMILARFLFPHQVAKRLYAMGWQRKYMPAKNMFNDLCSALRASGYNTEKAADLWNKCLQYDREAIEQLKRDSGLYGILHLSQFLENPNEPDEPSEQTPARKRKRAAKPSKPKDNT